MLTEIISPYPPPAPFFLCCVADHVSREGVRESKSVLTEIISPYPPPAPFFYDVLQITSLEREFGFTSFQSGRLLSANEIGFLCFVLPGGYLASRLHVPRAMAITAFLCGLAGVMSGLPHFLFFPSTLDHNNVSVVSAGTREQLDWYNSTSPHPPTPFFFFNRLP